MAQARRPARQGCADREVPYRNPQGCGCLVGVRLAAGLGAEQLKEWLGLGTVGPSIETLVARAEPRNRQIKEEEGASVAVGFSRSFLRAT